MSEQKQKQEDEAPTIVATCKPFVAKVSMGEAPSEEQDETDEADDCSDSSRS